MEKLESRANSIESRLYQQEDRSSSKGPGAVHEVNREALASRLFYSIDRSSDWKISSEELAGALQVPAAAATDSAGAWPVHVYAGMLHAYFAF